MIRFVIKVAFFLGLIALLMPGGGGRSDGPAINAFALLYGAQAAVADLSNFCDRAPSACAAGGDVARFAGDRVSEGFSIAYGFVDDAIAKRRRDAAPAADGGSAAGHRPADAAADTRRETAGIREPATDRITTAAIAAARLAARKVETNVIAVPTDRGVAEPAGPGPRLAASGAARLPTVAARPLQAAGEAQIPATRLSANVPGAGSPPRG
ncbi:DUF5330 domain-containing protein [Jiella sonneratiae]|uniref:DUF5330 domain-containing protein n=1 Tax=Jiella sonneratiae TaxID=2816856 RepID=A0ABS3JA01_9HYPH|nr:DUF5330 domain-containing protein [Jiella sonneratiae]MBO0905965.1 DUF5330 domain-containing protein [Jiella sonneratiae]